MRYLLILVILCGLCVSVANSDTFITTAKATHRWIAPDAETGPGQHTFEVTGTTSYPDGTLLNLALSYQGERYIITRTTVKAKKFTDTIKVKPGIKLLPAYYEIEIIFLPNRQDATAKVANLPESSVFVTARVGHTEAIKKERENTLVMFLDMLKDTKAFYEVLRVDYDKYYGKKVDAAEWDKKYQPYLKQLKQSQQVLANRKNTYLIPLFSELEMLLATFLAEMEAIYNELSDQAKTGREVADLHGGGKRIKGESIIKDVDVKFYGRYEPLIFAFQLREKITDEALFISHIRTIDALYRESYQGYQNNLRKPNTDEWENFTSDWTKRVEQIRTDIIYALKDELADSFPEIYQTVIGLPQNLIDLHKLYDRHLSDKETLGLPDKIGKELQTFRLRFYTLLQKLGFQRLLSNRPDIIGSGATTVSYPLLAELIDKPEDLARYLAGKLEKLKGAKELEVCEEIVAELVAAGKPVVPLIGKELETAADEDFIRHLTAVLNMLGKESIGALPALLARLEASAKREESLMIRLYLIDTIALIGDKSAVPALIKCAEVMPPLIDLVLEALGRIGHPSAADWLIEKLADNELGTRQGALAALLQITQTYLKFNPSANAEVRKKQVEAIKKWREKNIKND